MQGQFITSTCQSLGLRYRAFVRNTFRNLPQADDGAQLRLELSVYERGERLFHAPEFALIKRGGVAELSAKTIPALEKNGSDKLIAAVCHDGAAPGYFAQEHQVLYTRADGGNYASLLYDQIPVRPQGVSAAPIVVLAPKIWLSRGVDCHVVFSNHDPFGQGKQQRPLELYLFTPDGKIAGQKNLDVLYNDAFAIDAKSLLGDAEPLTDTPKLFHLTAKGGSSSFVIYTILIDKKSGNLALEHSLPPPYYVDGDMKIVREQALRFVGATQQ